MTNPKQDIQKINEFIVSVATAYATKVHGRLQVRFHLADWFDGHLTIIAWPVINQFPWPKELVLALQKPPLGNLDPSCSREMCRHLYRFPLALLPIEFRQRRGKSISAGNRLAQIVAYSCSLRQERCNIDNCKEILPKLKKINVTPMIAALDQRRVAIETELRRSEREEEKMDVKAMAKQNELLFIDIAHYLNLEEGSSISLHFSVKDSRYPLTHRKMSYDPT